jgi:hypothetical protein
MARRYFTRRRDAERHRKIGQVVDFKTGRGYYVRRAKAPPKPKLKPPAQSVPPQQASPFAGKGLFTTSDAGSASGHPCNWVAVQQDPEGDRTPNITGNPARIMYWQARATQEVADRANERGIPYIGQAESQPELAAVLGLHLEVPRALVGNPTSWSPSSFAAAAERGFDLILEWYWNAMPWQGSPDARNYPRFVNVCFGIYDASSEHPGQGRRVPLADYRAVWQGSFSCWPAEGMTAADWAVFDRT